MHHQDDQANERANMEEAKTIALGERANWYQKLFYNANRKAV
jgi:hypothetical protein